MPPNYRPSLPGLPPGQRVVALVEIDGMPHPIPLPSPVVGLTLVLAIPEICLPGEGMFCWGPWCVC